MDNYLKIMEDSLRKKSGVLDKISEYNELQYKIFSEGNADIDKFDEYIDEKDALIEQLSKLDEGFETLYARIAELLKANKDTYAAQIRNMQQLVKEITDKSVSIQAQEARNKAMIEEYFRKQRSEITDNRRNANAAYRYYQTLSGANTIKNQFMDSKQ